MVIEDDTLSFAAIEMDNIEASEVQDIQFINKTARLFEVSALIIHSSASWCSFYSSAPSVFLTLSN